MTMDVTVHKPDAGAPIEGPGRLLREAREALNLSQDEMSRRLHLDLKMVKALESDDYKRLPPPIFVTGYLRNYARLTNLPADELIASYNRIAGAQPPPIKVLTSSNQGAEHPTDRPVQLTTYVMALVVLVVVLGLWWWQGREEPVAVDGRSAAPATGTGADVTADVAKPPENNSSIELIPVPIPGGVGAPPGVGETMPSLSSSPEMPVPGLNLPTPAVPPTSAMPSTPGAVPPVNSVPITPAVVKVTFEADSWLQITDAQEQRIFYDLGKKGVTRTLQGVPPFQVVIGYPQGVKMEYNGVPFDHSRFEQGGRASFVLGKAAGAN